MAICLHFISVVSFVYFKLIDFQFHYRQKMKVFLILSLATLTLASCGHAHPGGYTAKGGVVDFRRKLDYMKQAQSAAKMAWDKQFESELSVGSVETSRGERDATYIPTFFTSQQNHEALTNSRNDNLRYIQQISRD